MKPRKTFPCPHCGEDVREGRMACPSCGSDSSTGWQDPDELSYQSVDIPDTFEEMEAMYDAGATGVDIRSGAKPWVVVTALVLVFAMVAFWVLGLA